MSVELDTRGDFHLEHYRRVAWAGERVRFTPGALARMAECRASFMDLLDADQDLVIYGVTSGYGQEASRRLAPEERRRHAARPPMAGSVGHGEALPERISRGIVFARLANFVEGNAAVTPALAEAVAALLDGEPLPALPSLGIQSAGEILALSHLLTPLASRFPLAEKEMLSLVNGSPCGAALVTDATLRAERRLELALAVFALSAEALMAPHEAWDEALETLWDDTDETACLRELRRLLAGGADTRRSYQAPVSWRILPRMLGQARRATGAARAAARTALAAVTDNPVYIPPDTRHPHGRVLSNGGYHNARCVPAMDTLAAIGADLCLLCERHVDKLMNPAVSLLPAQLRAGDGYLGCLAFAAADCAEHARQICTATLLPASEAGGYGQNDVASPVFSAWDKQDRVGALLETSLAMLAVVASQALYVTERVAPAALEGLLAEVRETVSPLTTQRALGPEVELLAGRFRARTLDVSGA